jgi:peptide/nickel transport system substrate-binding protein
MVHQKFRKSQSLALTSLLMLVLFIIACGSAAQPAAQPAEQPQVREVIKEVEVTRQVPVEKVVEKEKIVEKQVVKEVPVEKVVFATPVAGVHLTGRPDWVSIGADHHYNGDLTFVHTANPGFLDLHYGASATSTLTPSGKRFNQLLMYDPASPKEIIGDLAESWEVKDNGMTYTFHLHDATWHDGTPVTAADIVFSLNRMAQPGVTRGRVPAIRTFYDYPNAEAIDEKTVKMPLKFPSATALGWLAVDYFAMYPKALENVSQDDFNCCFENSFGSGPWTFDNWKKGDSYRFDRYDNYFKNPQPYFDGLQVFIIKDYARRLATLKTRQVMGLYYMTGSNLPADMIQIQKETNGGMRFARSGTGSTLVMWLHWSRPPLDDARVRKAIYLALDRQEISDVATAGTGVAGSFFPPGYANTFEEIAQLPGFRQPKDQDMAEAKRLLAEAGFSDGFKLTFNTGSGKEARTVAEVVAAQLKEKFNIDVVIQAHDTATYYANMRDGTHDLSTGGTGLYFKEPEVILAQFLLKDTLRNPHNWKHPRIDELIDLQARELNPEVRQGMYKEMAEILHQGESHYIPIYWTNRYGSYDYRLQNFKPPYHPHTIWRWAHVWWDPNAENLGPDGPPID